MDEPLSNLDAKLRVQMRSEIARIQHDLGVTTIYVTHDQTEAMTMGDRVAVLRKGDLQQVDAPQALYEHPVNLFVAGFIGSPAMNLFDATIVADGDGLAVEFGGFRLAVPTRSSPRARRSAAYVDRVDRPGHPARGHGGRLPRHRCPGRSTHPVDGRAARGARVRRRGARLHRRPAGHDRRHEGAGVGRRPGGARGRPAPGGGRHHHHPRPAQPPHRSPPRATRSSWWSTPTASTSSTPTPAPGSTT